jgi:hypothetical protein
MAMPAETVFRAGRRLWVKGRPEVTVRSSPLHLSEQTLPGGRQVWLGPGADLSQKRFYQLVSARDEQSSLLARAVTG